jgi:hypothetical protein
MSAVFEAREVNHAVNAGKRGSAAAVSVRIEFLLGENVSAALTLKGHHDASDVNNLVDWMLRMAMSSSSVGGFLLGSPKAGYEWPAVFNGGKSTKTVIFPVLPWCWQRVAGCEWTEGRRGLGNAMLFDDG